MLNKSKLSNLDRDVLNYLNRVGFASTKCIQLAVRRNRFAINTTLQTLYKLSLIDRLINGVAVSTAWKIKHQDEWQQMIDYNFK